MTANAGYHAYATGDVLTAAQVQYNLQNQTVMYFATTTARDTALAAAKVEGMVSYTPATGLMYYNGTTWVAVGGGSLTSPLTTKGDIWGYSTTNARVPVGTDGQLLKADSSNANGVSWTNAPGMTLLSTTSLSGSSTTISSISQNYTNLILISSATSTTVDEFCIRLNGDTSNYSYGGAWFGGTTVSSNNSAATNKFVLPQCNMGTSVPATTVINLPRYTTTSGQQIVNYSGFAQNNTYGCFGAGIMDNKSAGISSITILSRNGYTISGTSYLYGVN